jgi:hypothetical protein
MRDRGEVDARLAYGEEALGNIAYRYRLARLLDASIAIVSGLAVIPIFLRGDGFDSTNPFDYVVIVSSGISVISGLVNLATRTDAERRWDAYQELRDRLATREEPEARVDEAPLPSESATSPTFAVSASPVRGGGIVGAVVTF